MPVQTASAIMISSEVLDSEHFAGGAFDFDVENQVIGSDGIMFSMSGK